MMATAQRGARRPPAKKATRPVNRSRTTAATRRSRGPRTAGGEDPRVRARRRQVGRSRLRVPLWIAGGLLVLVLLGIGSWSLLHTRWFSATTVPVVGATHETTAQVISAAGLASSPPLISIDPTAAATGVEQLAWIKSAKVVLVWPHTVKISVTERVASGAVVVGNRWLLVDSQGRILTTMDQKPFAQPIIRLPAVPTTKPGVFLGNQAIPAAVVAGTLPVAFRSQVASVIGHKDGSVTLKLTTPVTVDLGQPTDLTAKYTDIASVIAGATLHPGDVLNVSVPQAPTISGP